MTLNDFSEYDTELLLRLIENKCRWLDTLPSGDPRRQRLVQEINTLKACWLKLEAHTNWVMSELNTHFCSGLVEAMQHPLARKLGLNGYLFYWQTNEEYLRIGHERTPLIALKSNVPVHLPGMQIENPHGDLFTPLDLIRLGGAEQ